MPVDPSIELAGTTQNPLATIGQFATIQNALNQNRLFQQTFNARQKAGQIMAAAPDQESGYAALLKDPDVAPFAGEMINQNRQAMQTLADIQRLQAVTAGERQKQAQSGLEAAYQSMPAIMANPTDDNWDRVMGANLAVLSPQARADVAPAIANLKEGLIGGLDKFTDPVARQREVGRRFSGLGIAGKITPEGLNYAAGGTPFTQNIGGSVISGVQATTPLGGGLTASGPGIQRTAEPSTQTVIGPDGKPQVIQVPGQLSPQGAPNALGPAPTAPGNALGGQVVPPAVRPQTVATGMGVAEKAAAEKQGSNFAEYSDNLNTRVTNGGQLMQSFGEMAPLMEQARTGAGTEWRTKLAQIAQAAGLPDSIVNGIQGGSLPAVQELQKFMVQNAARQMNQILQTDHKTQGEFNIFQQSNPNVNLDPRASEKIYNFMSKVYRLDKAEQDELAKAQQKSDFNPVTWANQWQNTAIKRGLWSPNEPFTKNDGKTAPVRVTTPEDARKLAPGTHFVTPDGRELVR